MPANDFYKLPYPMTSAAWKNLMKVRREGLKKRYPKGYVSKNFRYIEFQTHDGTPIPLRACKGLEDLCKEFLEPMRARFGSCFVLSGYRHYQYNMGIPGAVNNSQHDWDQTPGSVACDLRFSKGSPKDWAAYARQLRNKMGYGGVGRYDRSNFVHVDNRPYIADWKGN